MCFCMFIFVGAFLLVYWIQEESVSVLECRKVTGSTTVGSESEVKLGKTVYPVKIAAAGMQMCMNVCYTDNTAYIAYVVYIYIYIYTTCTYMVYRN